MQVVLLYRGQRVMKATTRSPEGCFILQGRVPLGSERIYGPCSAQRFSFPPPGSAPAASLPPWMAEAMNRLLRHLERGVLLWVAPDGVFIKRFCRGRVYWSGPGARHADRPNKLERDKTVKLLDAPTFLSGEATKKRKKNRFQREAGYCSGSFYCSHYCSTQRGNMSGDGIRIFQYEMFVYRAPEMFTGDGADAFVRD